MKWFDIPDKDENPLKELLPDGGYTAIFRKIACVGDSLSSGEFEAVDKNGVRTYHDIFEHSWGQYIARMTGSKVYNFSRGGMTGKEYCESFADLNGFWDSDKKCHAYIIALGVNDIINEGQELGSIADIDLENYENNKKTFAGYLGIIIQKYREIQPHARFFLVSMPKENDSDEVFQKKSNHAKLLYDLAKFFPNTYVVDLFKHAPVYDDKFNEKFALFGHLNPAGYLLTAKMIATYIDHVIRSDFKAFKQVGMIEEDDFYDVELDK